MMAETPLDVLSRAATMVNMEPEKENNNNRKRNGSMNGDSHKELPTRLNRQRRSTERRDLSQALNFDDNHKPVAQLIPTTTTTTTGTQTVLVGVRLEDSESVGIPQVNPALPTDSSKSALSSTSIANQPTGIFGVVRPHQLRPSVITCAGPTPQREVQPTSRNSTCSSPFRPNGYTSAQTNNSFRREITSSGFCDPVIEEHFRRSLGDNYEETLQKSPDVPKDNQEVSITGSVDDHFAKALGDQWTNIKKTVDTQKKVTPPTSPAPSSPAQSSSPAPSGDAVFMVKL